MATVAVTSVAGDLAAAGGPGVDGLFLRIEIAGDGGDGDGIAGEDVRRLNGARELNRRRRCDLAEAENDASGETVGEDFAYAAGHSAGIGGAVVDVRVMKVGLNWPERDAVVEGRKDVIEADAAGETPAPGARLKDGSTDFGSAEEDVGEGHAAIFLVADNWAGLSGKDAVVGAGGEEAAFGLDTHIAIEVACGTGDSAGDDGLVLDVEYIAVDWMKVAEPAIYIEARGFGRWRGRSLDRLGGCGQSGSSHEERQ